MPLLRRTAVAFFTAGALQAFSAFAAQENSVIDSAPSAQKPAPQCDCRSIPALTVISIEVMAPLGSKISKTGDVFPITLATPIIVDGVEAVAAGTQGMGEVVHAKKSGGMGAAGELVLAARYLDVNGKRLKLRSLRLVPEGKSAINTVNAINVASAASPLTIGLDGFFISGGQINIPQGTIVEAKTAELFTVELTGESTAEPEGPAVELSQ